MKEIFLETIYSVQFEMQALSTLMQYPKAWDSVSPKMHEDLFYSVEHQNVFKAIRNLKTENNPSDLIFTHDWLVANKIYEDEKANEILFRISNAAASIATIDANVAKLTDLSSKRRARRIMREADDLILNNPKADASDVINQVASDLLKAGLPSSAKQSVHIDEAFRQLLEDVDPAKDHPKGHETGFYDLDKMIGGLEGGDLVIIAARPSMGKTAFCVNILDHIVRTTNKVGIFLSLEMPQKQITRRIISARSGVLLGSLRDRNLTAEDWLKITPAMASTKTMPLYINDTANQTAADVANHANELKRKHGPIGAIAIDYLGLMGGLTAQNRNNDIGEITKRLKILAKELDCPILLLSQLNRELEKRPNKRPLMSDLRDSGNIEQDADIVIFLYRDEYYNKEKSKYIGVAEAIIAKQRNGAVGPVYLGFQGQYARFTNLDNFTPDEEE